jgi:hypothetical protein
LVRFQTEEGKFYTEDISSILAPTEVVVAAAAAVVVAEAATIAATNVQLEPFAKSPCILAPAS